jgi:DNA-directed RNA polymerase specialized sigma24 family protein
LWTIKTALLSTLRDLIDTQTWSDRSCGPSRRDDKVRHVVLDFHAPSSRLVLEEVAKPRVRTRLHKIALLYTGSDATAEDLVAEALARACDPDRAPWSPEKSPFLTHMTFVIRKTWYRSMRKASVQLEILDGGIAQDERTVSPEPRADDELHRRRELALHEAILEEVVTEIEDEFPLVRPICELGVQGVEEPAEQAKELARPVEEIYRAIKALKRHARQARADRDQREQRRMASVRAQAVPRKTEVSS